MYYVGGVVCTDYVILWSTFSGPQIFLVRLSRHPVLNKSYWFHDFLSNVGTVATLSVK